VFILKAYELRKTLSDAELERLEAGLQIEVERYRSAIENYPPERMAKHGAPHLALLEARVTEVRRIRADRSAKPL
jgi:hypothetical protein